MLKSENRDESDEEEEEEEDDEVGEEEEAEKCDGDSLGRPNSEGFDTLRAK